MIAGWPVGDGQMDPQSERAALELFFSPFPQRSMPDADSRGVKNDVMAAVCTGHTTPAPGPFDLTTRPSVLALF